jgi:hypothetical protein
MKKYFEPIVVTTLREMMEWNRNDLEREVSLSSNTNEEEIPFDTFFEKGGMV